MRLAVPDEKTTLSKVISIRHKFIFVHIPKTGGSSFEHVLNPFSEDSIVAPNYYDGRDLIEIQGISPRKHADLQDYFDILGPGEFPKYRIAVIVRDPWCRAVSYYFSPHRWIKKSIFAKRNLPGLDELLGRKISLGEFRKRILYGYKAHAPVWDRGAFMKLAEAVKPMADYIKVGGEVRIPDIVIRFENYDSDMRAALAALGLPYDESNALPFVNKGKYGDPMGYLDEELGRFIVQRFRGDYDLFNYKVPFVV